MMIRNGAHQAGCAIAAVSSNSREAVTRFLATARLAPLFTTIVGRTDPDPVSSSRTRT
jgi:beta-phosphoglucomutase-like phosphatase (HAD superfamily)